MSQAKTTKPSRSISEHIKRAVRARDGSKCRNCHVETEFLHFDHIIPFDLGGPTTADNLQLLCPKCNTSKGNRVTCQKCGHWMAPTKSHCEQCGAPLAYTKYKDTLAGRAEGVFQRVGKAVVIGGVALVLLIVVFGGIFIMRRFSGGSSAAVAQSSNVSNIINQTISVGPNSTYPIQFTVPDDAVAGRMAGGFKVTSGDQVDVLVVDSKQYQNVVNHTPVNPIYESGLTGSKKINVKLDPGSYYLVFNNQSANNASVAAEFYVGHK
ncbi:MAG: HNH endonuclease [Acidobacteriota bacterium]|nr:HNH endonuclease [Acidobacteriota bacterium]